MANEAASKLNLSCRQIYNLLKCYQNHGYQLLALLPQKSHGGKGQLRIYSPAEQVIQYVIDNFYLTQQQTKISLIVEQIISNCKKSAIIPPSASTIRRRIAELSNERLAKRLRYRNVSKQCMPILGHGPQAEHPHDLWQIDHTLVDLIIVDETFRKPIGRPYLTLAIDVFSRCITGFCLTLDAPSTISVGLCLTHGVFNKEEWLSERKIKTDWPIWGKPKCIHVYNAREFHSEGLSRGCDAHGITIIHRPPGQPHYGGVIERVIGTFMQLIHSLPGTTFSNITEKANYPSEKLAVLTLSELEYWLTIAITDYYHQKIHRGIQLPPIEKYRHGILGDEKQEGIGYPVKIVDKTAFLIDFLPTVKRSIQRHGFVVDHITYNSPALSPLIAERKKHEFYLIRRDPRDLSHIYVLEPHSQRYIEVGYRTLSRPTITLWEHNHAVDWLNKRGIFRMNEILIFQAIDKLRELVKEASHKTKSARRQQQKTANHLRLNAKKMNDRSLDPSSRKVTSIKKSPLRVIKPYDEIEIW